MKLKHILVIISLLAGNSPALASDAGHSITANFQEIKQKILDTLSLIDGRKTLVVFDIDNTILRTDTDFGSEHWFLWQKELIEKGVTSVPAVTDSLANLLTIQGWIYQITKMRPVASEIPAIITTIRRQGAAAIALTSRTLGVRDATLRELENNRMEFSSAEELGLNEFLQPKPAYSPLSPGESGLSEADISEYALTKPLLAEFDRGVFFTQGQHKGILLKILLHASAKKFTHIIFVDDRPHHVAGMRAVFQNLPESVYTFQFTKSAEWIIPFQQGEKLDAREQWCQFSLGLGAFPGLMPPTNRCWL